MKDSTGLPTTERVEVRFNVEETKIFHALILSSRHETKAAYARDCLLRGEIRDLDELARIIGEIGFSVNQLLAKAETSTYRADLFDLSWNVSRTLAKVGVFLTRADER